MSKVEERALEAFPLKEDGDSRGSYDLNVVKRIIYQQGYQQAEKDIKEELSSLFQEFMLDYAKDDTETHILHFIDVFNNKIKTIGNE